MLRVINVLSIADYFIPGFCGGGPITTLVNMRRHLAGKIDLAIFTRDRDLGATDQYSGIETNQWVETPDGPIYYASPNFFGPLGLRKALVSRDFDLIYLNSFFSPRGAILPYLMFRKNEIGCKILIAPRGEFSKGAISLKGYKKKMYLTLARTAGLYEDIYWHASTAMEAEDILRLFPNAEPRLFIAADPILAEVANLEAPVVNKKTGYLRIAFISRISRMKNIDGLINILSAVSSSVLLDIYGPVEDEPYWKYCADLIEKLPGHIRVAAHGPVAPDAVSRIFSRYDLFAFPTHGENFGHVIFEALRAGTPVLVSDQTPWQQDETGALKTIPLADIQAWRCAIECAANRSAREQGQLSDAARRYASSYAETINTQKENLELFFNVLSS